ncbi:hypothetical protein PMKS-003291 [Pichia membranifaciens]|uniref:Uncharacterized protein n=1 Tax=Pichia membranifaciens TaxID=4926 RepID=A0A1Q2YJQ7_9ASCO|nr:hypothetical protein PMKS-003291 [Pichia membranifaciens]
MKNLFLPNSLFTQDKIDEEDREISAANTSDQNLDDKNTLKHTQISPPDFKLPHSTSQSTRNTTLNTSSLEVNTNSSQLPNQAAYYMQKSQQSQPPPQLASLSLVVPDSTTSLSSSSSSSQSHSQSQLLSQLQSQSQYSQSMTEDRKTNLASKSAGNMDDSTPSTKTLLPLNNEPLRSKNPLLQFSQLSGSLLQMKVKKNPGTKKAKSRKLKKAIGSTDDEDERFAEKDPEGIEEEKATSAIPNSGKRISSFGLQPISTDKIGKITGSKTFISEEIGLDDTMKIASSGGLFDDDDRHHRQKEIENIRQERIPRTRTQREEETNDSRRSSRNTKQISTVALELSASENDAEESDSLEVLQVNAFLNALEEQSDSNIEKVPGDYDDTITANHVADDSKEKSDVDSTPKSDILKVEESQATQSNVINEMLNFYEEEFQNQQLEDTQLKNEYLENRKNSAEYSNLFVPEDESYDSNLLGGADEQLRNNDGILKEGELRGIEDLVEDDEDDEDKILVVKKDRKKQISHRLMKLARQKRKKKLSEYNPYSNSDSSSEGNESTSDSSSGFISSANGNKSSKCFVVNDKSVEFDSDSDSGDELTKNELLTKLQERSERENKASKKRKKNEIEANSSDAEQQQRKQLRRKQSLKDYTRNGGRRTRTRSSGIKEKKIEGKDIIVLDSDSDESLDDDAEAELDNPSGASVVKTEHPLPGNLQMALFEGSNTTEVFFQKADFKEVEPEELGPNETERKEPEPKEHEPTKVEFRENAPEEHGFTETEPKETTLKEIAPKKVDVKEVVNSRKVNFLGGLQILGTVKHNPEASGKERSGQLQIIPLTNDLASPTDCIHCTRENNSEVKKPCNHHEMSSNRKKQEVACGYHPGNLKKVDKNLKKSARKQLAKKKKRAPKITDNSLLEKLNERLRNKHGKKKDKRNGQAGP